MGDIKLCLLLLVSSYSLAQQNDNVDDQTPTCLLATRFRTFKKYVYRYTTESRNGVTGTANLRNGPKVTCQVEIEVPQTCSFLMHTRDCVLSEVSVIDLQGQPVYRQATGAEAFQAAMEMNSLKFMVKEASDVKLFPEPDEPVNIVNIKRGIISALMVPVQEEEHYSYMNTVHGLCKSKLMVNARKDIVTDVTVLRDLSECDHFYSRRLPHSPLALLQGWNVQMSRLITSSQDCNYQFDNRRKHMTTAECTEKHLYLPFSHENNGISTVVTQTLTLQDSAKINNKYFEVDPRHSKPLYMEQPEDKAPVQTKDATLSTLQDLKGLSNTDQGQRRASLFHKLVSGLRTLRNETLSQTVDDMREVSGMLSWQALAQCGTPECTSAILQAIRAKDGVALERDAFVYALGLQSHPDSHRVRDMLSMAEYKQSKAIMYALASTVRRFHDGQVTPEVTEVAMFMKYMLGDCLEDQDVTFLTLRVIGVMGKAMQDVDPSIKSPLLICMRQSGASLSVQKAAIQAFRLMSIDEDVKSALLEVYQDAGSSVQKRVAAYLMLMKSPDQALVTEVVNTLKIEQEPHLRNFVASHLDNIFRSEDPNILDTRQYITEALQKHVSPASMGFFTGSSNYRMDNPLVSTQGNILFDSNESMPKEVMLKTTLKAFGFNVDILEVGIEGNGFEPSLEALFGKRGFFPDSASKAIYWTNEKIPGSLKEVLENWIAPTQSERMKRQAPQDLFRYLGENFQKLVVDLGSQNSPEAMAYLRFLGNELGYIKSSEMQEMANSLSTYYNAFFRVLPTKAMAALLSSTDSELYAQYIFLENAFSLPSASGLPLKFSLTGVFAAGAKGGFSFSPGMQLSFMPSVGVEFITQMGIHVPEFVVSGVEMHTNVYHESAVNSKITVSRNQIKLSIPAPKGHTQLLSVSNQLLSVASHTMIVPSVVEDRTDSSECQPLFTGLKYCTILRYSNASSTNDAPYYPLTGETRFAVEIHPTGEVSGYSAAIASETQRDEEGRREMEILKLTLKAEGAEPTEASATLKYNRNTLDTEINIPDFDLEAGIKLAVTDSMVKGTKMRGITVDVTNKNIPQFTLIGRVRLETMNDGMLQIQMAIPSLSTEASATAVLKNSEGLVMQFSTAINMPQSTSLQNIIVRYDNYKFEVEMMSDIKSDIQKLIPNTDNYQRQLQELIDNILDQKVAKTDMKLRHIVSKGIEAGKIWLDKFGVPYVEILRNKRDIAEFTLPKLPEMLFLQCDSFFRYQFNQNTMTISLPVPLGGSSSEDLNIPTTLSVPLMRVPLIGIEIPANDYPVPSFTIPHTFDFKLPLIGLAEVSTKINSNFYSWEGSISGGNNTKDIPNYIAQYTVMAQSPINPLSYKLEGTGMISGTVEDNLKYLVNGSFSHSLFDASFSVLETLSVTDNVKARANYKMEASSPLGLHTSLYYSAKSASTAEEVTGDGTLDGSICVGSFYTNSTYSHNYVVRPLEREGRGESNLRLYSPLIQAHNIIQGVYSNSELSILSKTNVQNDALKHVAELKYKNAQLTLKCDAASTAFDKAFSHKVELGLSSEVAILRVESQADDATNRAYSLITGTLNYNGLEVNSEGSLTFTGGRGLHKASATANRNGMVTSGTTSLQCSPVTFESIFDGGLDSNGLSLSFSSKGMAEESRGEFTIEGSVSTAAASLNSVFKGNAADASIRNTVDLKLDRHALKFSNNMMGSLKTMKTENTHTLTLTLWTLALRSKVDNYICEDAAYKHNIMLDMKPFVTSMNMKNDLKLFDVTLNNEGQVKVELYKMDLSGSFRGAYGEDQELRHTYEIHYADLTGTLKCSTTGNLMDAQYRQNCELEFAGLASKSNCEARIDSKSLRFDSTIRTLAVPFSLTIDAIINSDSEMNLYGEHTGQLYSKLLVKAEPLALAYSHHCRASTSHLLERSKYDTHLDNKCDSVVTPSEQSLTWKTKSKLNNHAYNQDINTYNNPKKLGLEFSGLMSTDFFSKTREGRDRRSEKENAEFSISGFLKYDKNSDSHIIELPFIKSLPVAFDQFKTTIINALESMNQYIKSLNIDQLIHEFRSNLNQLPHQVSDFMEEIDLESKVKEIKNTLNYLTQEYALTLDDLENSVENLRINLEQTLINVASQITNIIASVKEYIDNGDLSTTLSNVLSQIGDELRSFDDRYEFRQTIVRAIDAAEDIIRQMDVSKLQDSSVAWFQDLDAKFRILAKLQEKLDGLKQVIDTFDVTMFLQDLKDYILSINFSKYIEHLNFQISSEEMTRVLESAKDVIVNWIEEYAIEQKINAVYFYVRDLLLRYDVDEKIGALLQQVVVLIQEFRIEQTLQTLVDNFKTIYVEAFYDKFMEFLDSFIQQLNAIDFKQSIDRLNEHISLLIKAIKSFDYNVFVDDANQKIIDITNYVNEQIKEYEIAQKIEASREFVREIQGSIFNYLEQLKNTKIAEIVKMMMDLIDTTTYNDIKMKAEEILEDMRQRVIDMDIRKEMYIYLGRASESYSNMIAFISVQFNKVIEQIRKLDKDQEIVNQISQAVDGVFNALKSAKIEIPSFVIPITDLVIPTFEVYLNKLQDINIPADISIPEFTIVGTYTVPAFTIDLYEIKAKIIALIDRIREIDISIPEPDQIFGDLKALYMPSLPDLTFPEVTLSEIRFPAINIPKLNLENFEITMLPISEIKLPEVPSEVQIPAFGKLYGELRINSPHYTLVTAAGLENSTLTPKTPQFTATLTSQAKSTIEFLDYSLDATARLEAPRMKKLVVTESVKATHMTFTVDHEGSLTLSGPSAEASAKTTAKATTNMYAADAVTNFGFSLKSGISASMDTTYNHNLNIPTNDISSQVTMTQTAAASLESGTISVTVGNIGSGKWSFQDYSDEGTHKSDIEFNINFGTAKFIFGGETKSKAVNMKQTVTAESVIFSHITVEGRAETELPFIKSSVMILNGEVHVGDLKMALIASNNAEIIGRISGNLSNSLELLVKPFEIVLDYRNKVHSKTIFPLKLTGKVDLQQDYGVILNSEVQRVCWTGLARFNQYKYNHNFSLGNNPEDITIHATMNGEANLEFLTVPLTIPEMTMPYLEIQTPAIKDMSLWEHAGLKILLTTPRQSFDMNLKLQYQKNPDMHAIYFDLEPIYNALHGNADVLRAHFELGRDKLVDLLTNSYNKAKKQLDKYKISTAKNPPRIFTVPGYKIPMLNIEVSAFRAELPAFSFVIPKEVSTPSFKVPTMGFSVPSYTLVLPSLELPVLHVPETLSELTLPTFTLPAIKNNIMLPAMGNITYDFSFKSTVITMTTNAGLYNQSDTVAKFGATSTSVFDILNGKISGTTSLTKKRGIKLATAVTLEHKNMEGSHDCTISLSRRGIEASMANVAKVNLPFMTLELNQELFGNTKAKPNAASKIKLKYMCNIPVIEAIGKGIIEQNLALEGLSSYFSLETTTKGMIDITVMESCNVAGRIDNDGNLYLNTNGLRTTVKTDLRSNIDHKTENILSLDVNENLALEASLRRVYATYNYTSNNNANIGPLSSKGKHFVKATLDFVPLTTLTAQVEIDFTQPCSFGDAVIIQHIDLAITSDKQTFSWSSKEQIISVIHACELQLTNDEAEVRLEATGSLEAHLAFLKSVKIPVYQKTVWDILKFDQATSIDKLQFLNVSSSVVYAKNMDGLTFDLPAKLFEDGVIFSISEYTFSVPTWIKEIPQIIRKIDMRFENVDLPDQVAVPPVISFPPFDVPFTTLHVAAFTIDLKNLEIPKVITTTAFDIMLPYLLKMEVPSFDINTEYLQNKMSFLSMKIPQYEIIISSLTFPKSLTIGERIIHLDDITNYISNFEIPTITIPEQNMEIPEITLNLPVSVFIPAFGTLSTTVKVSSPIYNITSTAKLEKKDSSLVTSLKSTCTSTMIFVEYDLDATTTLEFENGVISLNGKCNLIHSDVNVDWQHVFAQNLRMKRQTSPDVVVSRHTLEIDLTSPTFVDVNFRYASRKDGITASVSSPSSGFLGFLFQRRSPSQVYGKIFSRYLSTPDKDTDILSVKATLRNSEKLSLQTAWNLDGLHQMIEGSKERIPAVTEALLKFMNKYHTAHFGYDVNRAFMKLKNSISNVIERAYHEVPMTFDTVKISIQQLSDQFSEQSRDMYMKTIDNIPTVKIEDFRDHFLMRAKHVLQHCEQNIKIMLDAVSKFLSETKFSLPGFDEKLSGQEIYQSVSQYSSTATDRAGQRLSNFMETLTETTRSGIGDTEFKVPGFNLFVSGKLILEKVSYSMGAIQDLRDNMSLEMLFQKVTDFLQLCIQKTEEVIASFRAENREFVSHIDSISAEIRNTLHSTEYQLEKARKSAAEYKDFAKLKVQEVYNGMTLDRVNNDLNYFIGVFQSQLFGMIHGMIDLTRQATQNTAPYVRVSSKKMDVDVPLPFFWKSFSEWPAQIRQ
ncbi:apolipoprotein B-100 [Osmerus mordax]|uniref:apolipoprotein B-100 n=1 Tax=Osmerus mordax TaxID=8014 RepID=UPI00350FD218